MSKNNLMSMLTQQQKRKVLHNGAVLKFQFWSGESGGVHETTSLVFDKF